MTAKILNFRPRSLGAPMSQVPPLPRVDVVTVGDWPEHHYEVRFVRTETEERVVGRFCSADDAEAFAERWMGDHPHLGGGRWTGFDDEGGAA